MCASKFFVLELLLELGHGVLVFGLTLCYRKLCGDYLMAFSHLFVAAAFHTKSLNVNGARVDLQIWDTGMTCFL